MYTERRRRVARSRSRNCCRASSTIILPSLTREVRVNSSTSLSHPPSTRAYICIPAFQPILSKHVCAAQLTPYLCPIVFAFCSSNSFVVILFFSAISPSFQPRVYVFCACPSSIPLWHYTTTTIKYCLQCP